MEINNRNIKLMSTIGPRAAFGLGVTDLAKTNKEGLPRPREAAPPG